MSRLLGPLVAEHSAPKLGYLRDILKLSRKAIADLNQLSALVAVSQATADFHIQQGLDPTRVHVIYNGVDLERFCPVDHRAARSAAGATMANRTRGSRALVCWPVGNAKGNRSAAANPGTSAAPIPALPALARWPAEFGQQEAVDYEEQIRQQMADSSWRDRVHWLGRRGDVPELMQCADLLVHPARQEPLGRVLLEACASGLPVVTTAVGGSPEIFERGLSEACLVPPDDPSSMAEAIDHWLQSHDQRMRRGHELRDLARRRFSVASAASRLERLY